MQKAVSPLSIQITAAILRTVHMYLPNVFLLELCADELVVGGGVGWCYDRRRRRAAHFLSAVAAASAASDRMREH